MLITFSKGEKVVLQSIEDDGRPVKFNISGEATMTTPSGEKPNIDLMVVDCTALNEENEQLRAEIKELKSEKIFIIVCAFLACVLALLLPIIAK